MTDLINGLGGPTGFGENRGPVSDDGILRGIDVTPVFEDGLRIFGRSYDTISISPNGFILLEGGFANLGRPEIRPNDPAGFYLYWADHLPRRSAEDLPATPNVTPGGTSTGSNAIWYDLDPEAGTLTITWDDVAPFSGDRSDRNAYQLQFTDLSGRPGASEGALSVEYRYEAVDWIRSGDGAAGFSLGDGLNAFTLPGSDTPGGRLALDEQDPVLITFDGEEVTSNLPGLEEIPLFGPPILGTDGNDRLIGSDETEAFRPDRGRDTIDPGLGADLIDIRPGANTVRGTLEELLGDTLEGGFDNDRLLFEDVAVDRDAIRYDRALEAIILDVDGDGAFDDGIAIRGEFDNLSVLTATAPSGTYAALVQNLPNLGIRNNGADRFRGDQNTEAYLRGDGRSDFVLRLDDASTTNKDGLALGVYTYDGAGVISNARLLTTDVRATGEAEFLLDDIGRGERIGVFAMTPDEAGALDDIDSFAFVDETGGEAGFDDGSYVFAQVDGEIISAELIHSARDSLNADLQQRALIGMTERDGVTIVMEDGLFAGRDFNDIVLSIERLAVDAI